MVFKTQMSLVDPSSLKSRYVDGALSSVIKHIDSSKTVKILHVVFQGAPTGTSAAFIRQSTSSYVTTGTFYTLSVVSASALDDVTDLVTGRATTVRIIGLTEDGIETEDIELLGQVPVASTKEYTWVYHVKIIKVFSGANAAGDITIEDSGSNIVNTITAGDVGSDGSFILIPEGTMVKKITDHCSLISGGSNTFLQHLTVNIVDLNSKVTNDTYMNEVHCLNEYHPAQEINSGFKEKLGEMLIIPYQWYVAGANDLHWHMDFLLWY